MSQFNTSPFWEKNVKAQFIVSNSAKEGFKFKFNPTLSTIDNDSKKGAVGKRKQ
jgi:hypothetical protein